jgi:hypothetical protein
MTTRTCGDCQLCCRLLPTEEIAKPALKRCPHQKHGVGCSIYERRPLSCQLWNCRWLTDADTVDLPRPDRSHYVIDMMPDYITATIEGGKPETIPVYQVWVDPAFKNAHRAPSFRRWLDRQRMPAVIRYGSREGFVLFPASMTGGKGFIEHESRVTANPTTLREKAEALGGMLEIEAEIVDDKVGRATLKLGGREFTVAANRRAV